MQRLRFPAAFLMCAIVFPAAATAQSAERLDVTLVRFFRPPDTTFVAALCRVPLPLLDLVHAGKDGWAAYRVAVTVRDWTGRDVWHSTWRRTVPAARLSDEAGGLTFEWTRVVLQPGHYIIRVTATDSATGRSAEAEQAIDAFAASHPPPTSDLLLAKAYRLRSSIRDTVPRAGEFDWEGVFLGDAGSVSSAGRGGGARVTYFAEVYPSADDAALDLVVQGALGDPHGVVAATPRSTPTGRAIVLGYLALKDLGDGTYAVRLAPRDGKGSVADSLVRAAAITIARANPAPEATAAAAGSFEEPGEAQLDSLYAPLSYLMRDDERGSYAGLDVGGKREYLRRFWERRDPTPGTPRNEAREDFYERIRTANREFREGGAAEIPGWRTDRGRIFIRYGPPDEVLRQPQPPNSPPYEAWKYTRGRRLKYVFVDLTRFGNYTLVYTTDIHEPSRPGWWDLLGSRATEDVLRF